MLFTAALSLPGVQEMDGKKTELSHGNRKVALPLFQAQEEVTNKQQF